MYANPVFNKLKYSNESKAKILLIYTGGTIWMSKDFETGALKAFNFNKYYKNPRTKIIRLRGETFSFENPIDSSNMNPRNGEIATIIETNYAARLMVLLCFTVQTPCLSICLEFYA
jgi:L-asparaginase/Glu-tRNA(Gln) amidotransferase subunit D